jgi:hypothetical protein
MTLDQPKSLRAGIIGVVIILSVVGSFVYFYPAQEEPVAVPAVAPSPSTLTYEPHRKLDTSGFSLVSTRIPRWPPTSSLEEIASLWKGAGHQLFASLDRHVESERALGTLPLDLHCNYLLQEIALLNYEGESKRAYEVLAKLKGLVESDPVLKSQLLYTVIYYQGIVALRQAETDNCILCRGESSCILPISPAAVHTKPMGSRLAIGHFTDYLAQFPSDLEVLWLLNLAHMTLGEYPNQVDPRYLLSLDRYNQSEFGIGKFRDISHLVGITRLNQAGGALMDDFDNDGLLDLVFTSYDPAQPMLFYRNKGDGTFEDRTEAAGLAKQLGGLNCVQTDYNNDGFLDILIIRGAWAESPMRMSLLRNNGNGTFTDVTVEAGLDAAVNSISAMWADYDNDGFLDLFVCCERQPNRLYHNRGDGTFEEVAPKAGVMGTGKHTKGAAWLDFDRDGYPDLFVTNLNGTGTLYRNNRNGTFTDVSAQLGIDGPKAGFACWAWDYDNDGWPDIFATCYEKTVGDIVKGLLGKPHSLATSKLYRNLEGKGFQDVTQEAGLDMVFATMGCNFADFDNDGFLDIYLGTGDPGLSTLIPNRMFRNLGGKRFVEITGSSGTGHLQKGHGVACGDWDRDGNIDIAIELGGAIPGDQYHNVLFQNPGQGNNSITVKLVGKKTNRAAIGARIKVVTSGEHPLTLYRHVTSGSSFGSNPLEQTIGVGKADTVALLEIYWPTTGTTQTFRDVKANQFIEITEFAKDYHKKDIKRIAVPQ